MKNIRFICIVVSFVCVIGFVACTKRQGSTERAGERVDEIVDNIKEGEPPLKRKGTLEKVGEDIDEALSPDNR